MLQIVEHLRNTKASVVELQGVRDLLNSKADLTDVNAALSQVCCISFLHATTKLSLPISGATPTCLLCHHLLSDSTTCLGDTYGQEDIKVVPKQPCTSDLAGGCVTSWSFAGGYINLSSGH